MILSGKEVARTLLQSLRERVSRLDIQPGLAVVQVGTDPASSIYVKRKGTRAAKLGFYSKTINLPIDCSEAELLVEIQKLNEDKKIHGILVQLPLPKSFNEQRVLKYIDPQKDVDGFHAINAGLLVQGRGGLIPCTPKGVMHILNHYKIELEGKHAVVVGRSNIVGRPMVALLEQSNCTVTVCHSRTKNLEMHVKMGDIVVAAVGRPKMIIGEWIKPGAIVIDVGINRLEDGSICGDVDFESVVGHAGAITPVPGGVGPMTISTLMENTIMAATTSN
jgi:methylenetetrahydrofolate dehydrogenase (NADP+) / methenyltetrahydrofolate cyclohydrolase